MKQPTITLDIYKSGPDSTWKLTEKGKYLANLLDNEGLPFEEAVERTEKEFKS